jgi:prepilin-type N-terminal cleavage/methylation domain-containing protein
MRVRSNKVLKKAKATSGFTLAEVVISMAILAVVVQGVIVGYVGTAQRAEWNAHALAAQSLASQAAEQARSAKWDPQAWPQGVGAGLSDELGVTNYMQLDTLDVPTHSAAIIVTNYISITTVSANPALRQIRADCVWKFLNRGYFTNSVTMLRAPDQ